MRLGELLRLEEEGWKSFWRVSYQQSTEVPLYVLSTYLLYEYFRTSVLRLRVSPRGPHGPAF